MSVDVAQLCTRAIVWLATDKVATPSAWVDGVAVRPGSTVKQTWRLGRSATACGQEQNGTSTLLFRVGSSRVESSRVASSQPAGNVHSRDGLACMCVCVCVCPLSMRSRQLYQV